MHSKFKLNNFKTGSIALAACLILGTGNVFAGPEAGSNLITNGIGNFDAGVIDQTNLRQIKDYEQKVRDDREQEPYQEGKSATHNKSCGKRCQGGYKSCQSPHKPIRSSSSIAQQPQDHPAPILQA